MRRSFAWLGEDDPERLDTALASVDGATLTAHGTQRTNAWALAWALECGEGWITRRMRVSALGDGWARTLDLRRDDDGGWTSAVTTDGEPDLPPPGLDHPAGLDGALDCDLGLCPLTNVMPIRRLGLLDGTVEEQVLTMAWIEVPSLRVISSTQRYASAGPGRVRYESELRDFRAELTVDADGFVINYPGLARRVDPR